MSSVSGGRRTLEEFGLCRTRLRDSRSQLARLEIHSPGSFAVPNVPNPGEQDGTVSVEEVMVVGCVSRRRRPSLQPEWVQVYKLCRVKTIHIAAYSDMYNS